MIRRIYSRGTNYKHDRYLHFLLPRKLETGNEWDRKHDQPEIEGERNSSAAPDDRLGGYTMALMLPIPLVPEKADGRALEDECKGGGATKNSVDDEGDAKEVLGKVDLEDPHVEEDEREPNDRSSYYV